MGQGSVWKTRMLPFLAIVLLAVCAAAVLYPAIRLACREARRMERCNNLKHIGVALHMFDDVYHRLPPAVRTDEAGRPLSSWRFQIMPFVEAIMLAIDFDARWDDPENEPLSGKPCPIFCWSGNKGSSESLHPNVVAVTGPGTAFDADLACRLADIPPDTIIAIEVADWNCHWMEPGDLHVDQVPDSIVRGMDGDGVHVLCADASVWFVPGDVPLDDLVKFFTIDGARRYNIKEILQPHNGHR